MSKLIIVDLSSFIFRAYYAIRPLSSPAGINVNAVYGVFSMILKLIEDEKPTHLVLARDIPGPNFRHTIYKEYKANRSAPPADLSPQFEIIEKLMEKLRIVQIKAPGFEADDVIGSIVIQWKHLVDSIVIVSSDKDLMQFVGDSIRVMDTKMEKSYDAQGVIEKMGVRPDQIVDYLSMVGDASDNIPGIQGIGVKGAQKLLMDYQSLENCIENATHMPSKKYKQVFQDEEQIKMALLSKKLVTICVDIPLGYKLDELTYTLNVSKELEEFLMSLGFVSQLKKLANVTKTTNNQSTLNEVTTTALTFDQFCTELKSSCIENIFVQSNKVVNVTYFIFATNNHYFQLTDFEFARTLFHLCFEQKIMIVSFCIRSLCQNIGFAIPYYFDLSIAQYSVDPGDRMTLSTMSSVYLGEMKDEYLYFEDMLAISHDVDLIMKIMQLKIKITRDLYSKLKELLAQREMENVFYRLDNPMVMILWEMERNGIHINVDYLKQLETEFLELTSKIENEIGLMVKDTINLRSPKQVSKLLFEDLKLPALKKIKTGFSTDSQVLEELIAQGYTGVPEKILQFRELDKLLSTYIQVLPTMVDPQDKKIHTHFVLNNTATGRLSSEQPNLQNIPIKTLNGNKIRNAFYASAGRKFISLDYSQIELRLLAHMSEDPVLVKAFLEDKDVHSTTAAQLLGIPIEMVTKENRNQAKVVNFGLIYGQGSMGLAKTLNISRTKAQEYITNYFLQFPKVKAYLDSLKEKAMEKGYCETILGRKRYLPGLQSQNMQELASAQRLAVNSPIQGSAADLIKLAMIRIDEYLKQSKNEAKMVLQIHDELIFEIREDSLEEQIMNLKNFMEQVMDLLVPLKVDVSVGKLWGECT